MAFTAEEFDRVACEVGDLRVRKLNYRALVVFETGFDLVAPRAILDRLQTDQTDLAAYMHQNVGVIDRPPPELNASKTIGS